MCQVCVLYGRLDIWFQILGEIPVNIKYEDKDSQKVLCIYFTRITVGKFPIFQSL